jgi:hypothetical protein
MVLIFTIHIQYRVLFLRVFAHMRSGVSELEVLKLLVLSRAPLYCTGSVGQHARVGQRFACACPHAHAKHTTLIVTDTSQSLLACARRMVAPQLPHCLLQRRSDLLASQARRCHAVHALLEQLKLIKIFLVHGSLRDRKTNPCARSNKIKIKIKCQHCRQHQKYLRSRRTDVLVRARQRPLATHNQPRHDDGR